MFTERCYVEHVSNELSEFLESIGLVMYGYTTLSDNVTVVIDEKTFMTMTLTEYEPDLLGWRGLVYECKDVDMFRALASLNNTTSNYQWFVADCDIPEKMPAGSWVCVKENIKEDLYGYPTYFHKASREEIIKHFSNPNHKIIEHIRYENIIQ